MKKNIQFLVSFMLSFGVVMLIIVSGSKLVECWAPYYGSQFEMTLAVMAVGATAYEAAMYLPERVYSWIRKD